MVTELLGPTLSDLFMICGNKFSLKTTIMIGLQIVQTISYRSIDLKTFTTNTTSTGT